MVFSPASSDGGEGMFKVGDFGIDEWVLSGSTQADPKLFRRWNYKLHCAMRSDGASVKVDRYS